MNDLQHEQHTYLRKRFSDWATASIRELDLPDCALFLLDNEGKLIEYKSNFTHGSVGELASSSSLFDAVGWLSAGEYDNAIKASLASGQMEWNKAKPLFKELSMELAAAASPITLSTDKTNIWLVWIGIESGREIRDMFLALYYSFVADLELLLERQKSGRLNLFLDMVGSFHGKIDVNDVLTEVIGWMSRRFSTEQFDLLLSQDHNSLICPVKPLVIRNPDEDLCSRVFMEGRLLVSSRKPPEQESELTEIAAPLKGKQGIYGIIYAGFPKIRINDDDEAFISMLAENAGKAFEIAKLYEQSNSLISELRIINEITRRLNKSLQLGEIFQFACNELTSIFSADFCCIVQMDADRQNLVVQASNAELLVEEKFDIKYGFAGIICRAREPVIISDYQGDKNVESKLMNITQTRSLIGTPIMINGEAVGAILLVHRRPIFFSYDNLKMLQVLTDHIGLAITNATLHSEMRRMVITDQLTGLYVRHYLYEQIQLMQKKDFGGSLVVLDIDDFKLVNDTYGHQLGDLVLIKVSSVISRNIREGDTPARWGGEEFAVYLPQMNQEHAAKVANRIRRMVAVETEPSVTISCGIASWKWDDDQISVENLFHRADVALYEAKNAGKNQIRFSTE